MGLGSTYLFLYNVIQTAGWGLLGVQGCIAVLEGKNLWDSVFISLAIFQTAAAFEVVHCLVGLVRSSPMVTLVQVASRIFLVWGILFLVSQARSSIGFPILLFAWTITEIIRYSFYASGLISATGPPAISVWLRYTLFIVLYPIGVSGELLCLYTSLPVYRERKLFSVEMPNRGNFAFSGHFGLVLVIASYLPVFPYLYAHMFSQRRKVLKAD